MPKSIFVLHGMNMVFIPSYLLLQNIHRSMSLCNLILMSLLLCLQDKLCCFQLSRQLLMPFLHLTDLNTQLLYVLCL